MAKQKPRAKDREQPNKKRSYSATKADTPANTGELQNWFASNQQPPDIRRIRLHGDGENQVHMIAQLQQLHGNAYVQRVLTEANTEQQQSNPSLRSSLLQRVPEQEMTFEPITITANAEDARVKFARIRESVQNYSDNALDYLSNQYFSAMTSFKIWYSHQDKADASFCNAVVNLLMNSAWAWGSTGVGAAVAPIGSIIMLVAQESARAIQTDRDDFADSLILSANNYQASLQRKLRAKVPALLEKADPALWEEVEMRAANGEDWQPLLHDKGGLPRPGENYQTNLVSELIFKYKEWELSQQSDMYRGIYSMADPYLEHMRHRSQAEAYLSSGLPIPKRLSEYAREGERVEEE